MDLKMCDRTIKSPTVNDIREIVPSLGETENHFAILQKDEMTYLQTSNWKSLGYILEYQDGSLRRHYEASLNPTADQVEQAFIWYLKDDKRWLSAFIWKKIELGGENKNRPQQDKSERKSTSKAQLTISNAFQIFGLKHGSTKKQLKRQYRRMIAGCHPDRVNHLDIDFQKLAEEKTKLLNEAYEILNKIISI
jgi:DnaJ-domain-containing protein 1